MEQIRPLRVVLLAPKTQSDWEQAASAGGGVREVLWVSRQPSGGLVGPLGWTVDKGRISSSDSVGRRRIECVLSSSIMLGGVRV